MLREQGGGLVMQFSSIGGRVGGSPGIASYQAAKFAIDGFSRVLAAETAPFGVKVLVVEPSGFRTDWAGSSMIVHDIPEAYEHDRRRHEHADAAERGRPGRRPGSAPPRSSCRSPSAGTSPYHLPLGVNAAEMSIAQDRRLLAEDERWRAVSRSADFAEPYPAEFPPDAA